MRALLDRGRAVVLRDSDGAPPERAVPLTEAELRSRGAPFLLGVLLAGYSSGLVRNALANGPVRSNVVVIGLYLLMLLRSRRPHTRAIDTATALGLVACVFGTLHEWGYPPDAPALAILPGMAYVLYWLLGIEGVGLWFAAIAALLCFVYLPRAPAAAESVATVLLFSLAALAACGLYWRNLRDALVQQVAKAAAASDAARERRRLTTTFFHDQANLVVALEGASEPEDAEQPTPALLAELNALALRMRDHLSAMGELAGSGAVPAAELRPVTVRELFDGLALLFREPLARKSQRLVFEGDPALRLRAVPAVLLDSVLSNLVSNAIKFTPAGGSIRIGAEAREGEVLLRVLDEGSGMPAAVIDGLARSERLPSQTGSAGECGNGFGLVLAQQTTRRMGGALELGAPARGAEVLLRFPAVSENF
jgi:signal transduction histidine kinase